MDTSCYNSFSTIKKTIWSNNQFVFVLYVQWNRKWVVYNGKICGLIVSRGKRVVYNGKICDLYREESELYTMERFVICIERKASCIQWKGLWFVSRGKWNVCNGKICELYREESEMYAMERSVICIKRKARCMQWKDLWFVSRVKICVSRGKWNVCNQKICEMNQEVKLYAMVRSVICIESYLQWRSVISIKKKASCM